MLHIIEEDAIVTKSIVKEDDNYIQFSELKNDKLIGITITDCNMQTTTIVLTKAKFAQMISHLI